MGFLDLLPFWCSPRTGNELLTLSPAKTLWSLGPILFPFLGQTSGCLLPGLAQCFGKLTPARSQANGFWGSARNGFLPTYGRRYRDRYFCILGVPKEPRAFELELAVGQEEEGQELSSLSGHSVLSVFSKTPKRFHTNLIDLLSISGCDYSFRFCSAFITQESRFMSAPD